MSTRFPLLTFFLAVVSADEKRRVALRTAAEEWALKQVSLSQTVEYADAACPCDSPKLCEPIKGPSPVAELEVYGFSGGDGSGLDFTRVTTVAWADDPKLMCAAHKAGARVVMAAPGPEKVFTSNASARAEWVEGAVKAMTTNHMDGIVFDWESPCAPGAPEQRWYAVLIGETRAALRKLNPGYQVSVCVAWSPDGIDGRNYDIAAFAAASDLLYVMDYDTRSQIIDACVAGANAPYFGMTHGLERYLDLGVSPSQIVLGVPWYGCTPRRRLWKPPSTSRWPAPPGCDSRDCAPPYASADRYPCLADTTADARFCPIAEVPFRGINCSDAAGSEVAISGLLTLLPNSTTGRRWDPYQAAAYFNTVEDGTVVQHWYDDVESLRPKYAHARALGLRGVGPFTFTDTQDPAMYKAFDAFLKA